MKRLAVLISNAGTGTNLQAIINAIEEKKLLAEIGVVVSDTDDAYGLTRAKNHHIPTEINPDKTQLLHVLQKFEIDYVVLAGWKQFIIPVVIGTYKNRIVNIHPGLIPDRLDDVVKNPDGTNALWNRKLLASKAVQNFLDKKATFAGSSVHFLTHEFDFGPVLARVFEKIKPGDTQASLYDRLKKKEHQMYISVLADLCENEIPSNRTIQTILNT